jgi:hypothetical protein
MLEFERTPQLSEKRYQFTWPVYTPDSYSLEIAYGELSLREQGVKPAANGSAVLVDLLIGLPNVLLSKDERLMRHDWATSKVFVVRAMSVAGVEEVG